MNERTGKTPTPEDIEAQLRQIREDLSTLTRLLGELAGEKTETAKGMALDEAAELVARSRKTAEAARHRAESAAHGIEQYIEEKPVQSAMIALIAGMFIGWLSRR